MHKQTRHTLRSSVALGALLLIAVAASGCGVGLPTQPDVDPVAANGRGADVAGLQDLGSSLELDDASPPNSGAGGSDVPAGEIQVPTPSGPGSSAWGHSHRRKLKDAK